MNNYFTPHRLALAGLVGVLYFLLARLSLLLVVQPEGIASIWPASGFMLAVLLLRPRQEWPIIFAAVFPAIVIANLTTGSALALSAGFALANCVESLAAAWLVMRFAGHPLRLTTSRELVVFIVLAVLLSNAITALLGAAVCSAGLGASFQSTWLTWWMADSVGMLLVTPLVVTWVSAGTGWSLPSRRMVEALLLFGGLALTTQLIFGVDSQSMGARISFAYLSFPFLLWAVLRFGVRGTTLALTVFSIIAVWDTAYGFGPFSAAGQKASEEILAVQAFLSATIISLLAASIVIKERSQAEETLRLSEERYRNLSSVLWDYACAYRYISEDEARLEWVVGAFEEITGHPIEHALTNFNLSTPIHPDDQELFHRRHKKLRSGQDDISEFRIINARNEVRWVRSYGRPEWDEEHKQVSRVYVGVQDITERKQVEHELQQQRDFALQVMNALGQGVTVVNASSQFEYVNPAYARIVGLPPEQIIGKTPIDVTVPEDHAVLDEARSHRQNGETTTYETRFQHSDGRIVHVMITAVPRWQNGRIAGSIAVITDLTERKRSENLFRALLESAPDAMIIADIQGHITLVNSQAEQLFGYSKAELVGKSVEILMPQSFHAHHIAQRQRYVDTAKTRVMGGGQDLYAVRKDGTAFPAEISVSPIETDGQKLVASAIRDITLHKQAEQTLEDARMRAEEANKLKSEFLATMSHELRTPLNSIIGFSDAMLNKLAGEMNDIQREYIEIILNNGEHLLALINNVLDVSKIEAGLLELRSSHVNLPALLEDTRRNLKMLSDEKDLGFVTYLDPAMPRVVVGDGLRLKQILINLVGNAVKFTDAGHVEVRIMKSEDRWWTISVSDTGIGIPPEALSYVFDPFRQVDNSSTRRYEGSGLGLAIVQRLCKLMGGTVSVESEVNKGSTFTVKLPLMI